VAEGDTIQRTARRLDAALTGRQVTVQAPNPRGRAAGVESLDGKRLERVEARGKHLLLHFDGGQVLHSHLGMNGAWHVYESGTRWRKPAGSAWVVLRADGAEAAQFGGPTLRLLDAGKLKLDPTLTRLGPDILGEDFTVAGGVESLRSGDRTLGLGEALLDQRLLAGVGNIFKSEGCFAAAISPWHWLGELEDDELAHVIRSTRELMREAVQSGRQPRQIYGRAGEPCPRCGTPVRSRGQGDSNRTTYWCPSCQS
jgi:endonuclease VIII